MQVPGETLFDQYSDDYDVALAESLSATGEDKDYFARRRIEWLAGCLNGLHTQPRSVLDFGCGVGTATPHFLEVLRVESILGIDVSVKCIEAARKKWKSKETRFSLLDEYRPQGEFDLGFSNGTFHHIAPDQRAAAVELIYKSLRPGGILALWENSPWNPGTRLVMSRCPFDKDAVTLTPPEARAMLQARGFEILSTNFLFIFPRVLSWLRGFEPFVSRLPLGAQYQILCQKPGGQ
jgi:SAM-dependent methyltransferase